MKKIFVSFGFLIFGLTAVFTQTDPRATAIYQVKKYDLNVGIADRYLSSTANLTIQNVGTTTSSKLTLRINENAEINSVSVNGATANYNKGQEPLGTNHNLQRIIVNLPAVALNSTFIVSVDYRLKVGENSGLSAITPIESQFLPLSFWYPTPNSLYFPKGADFAPFTLRINGAESAVSSGANNGGTWEQKLNGQPFFLVGNWEKLEVKGVSVLLPPGFGEKEKQRANELATLYSEAVGYSADLLGSVPVPLRIVAVRRGAGFSDSGTILLDYAAFRREKIDSQTAVTLADAAAKIWFGNAKLVKGEGYGVIREGLSRYIATQFIEKKYGMPTADAERFRQRTAYATVASSESQYNFASPLDPAYFPSVSYKGAMIWRLIANQMGQQAFFNALKPIDSYSLGTVRAALATPYDVLDFSLTNATDTNLLVGLPQGNGGQTKVALRNSGSIPVSVNVAAWTETGAKLVERALIQPKAFGEVTFNTSAKIVRTEIDPEKYYPQTDYSDDVAPREFTDSNPIVAVKRAFDKADYTNAAKLAETILKYQPYLDEAQTWDGRAKKADNNADATKSFQLALDTKLPTPFSLAWSNLGLGDVSAKAGRNTDAGNYFVNTVNANAEYGATLAAQREIQKIAPTPIDESVKTFFTQFDKAVISAKKNDVEALIVPGEITKFASGLTGEQPDKWVTTVLRTEKIDSNYTLVELSLVAKRLNKDNIENGTAVFVLAKVGTSWKLAGIDSFEVR